MTTILKNSFSWSFSRYNLFNFCERAYYYHYYESWNGWDHYAFNESKKAFRLKHLLSKKMWLRRILRKSLVNAINTKPLSNKSLAVEFKHQLCKILFADINSIHSEEWRDDPKKICIDELYYGKNTQDQITDWIKSETKNRVDILANSKLLHGLSNVPYSAFSATSTPISFNVNSVKIWSSPDLIWNHHGKTNILNLNDWKGWSFLGGLYTLYAQLQLNYTPNNIVCHSIFFNEDNCFSVYGIRSPKEIINLIMDSSEKMQSRLTHNKRAYTANFQKTTEQKKCERCHFRAICFSETPLNIQ